MSEGLTCPDSAHNGQCLKEVFPGNWLHCYWEPNLPQPAENTQTHIKLILQQANWSDSKIQNKLGCGNKIKEYTSRYFCIQDYDFII